MHDSYEAVTPGETIDLGSCAVGHEEIRSFAKRYDPQQFHLEDDPDNPFGGLVASGWHTVALTMRLLVDGYLTEANTVGSPGLDGLRWREPVRPGDRLTATLTLGEKEPWDERRGLVTHELETYNQHDDCVLWVDALALYPRES